MSVILNGVQKGSKLNSSRKQTIRPTSDRVKEALFDILGSRIHQSQFLDLYAGYGGVGIDALSRGAKTVVFVDKSRTAINSIRNSITRLKLEARVSVILDDVILALRQLSRQRKIQFDIVFVDPPYQCGLAFRTLTELAKHDILSANAVVIVEVHHKESIPELIDGLIVSQKRKYGETLLAFYINKRGGGSEEVKTRCLIE